MKNLSYILKKQHCRFTACTLAFLAGAVVYSANIFAKKDPPLVFQYQVSHSRNVDQISLIFKEELYLSSNTSSFQKSRPVGLGLFKLAMNKELLQLRGQISKHYKRLSQTLSLLEYIQLDKKMPPSPVLLKINDEEMDSSDPHFHQLMEIIYNVWEQPWKCHECAIYKKKRKSIVRIVKQPHSKKKVKKIYSKKDLNCFSKNKKVLECVDPEFGIFEL